MLMRFGLCDELVPSFASSIDVWHCSLRTSLGERIGAPVRFSYFPPGSVPEIIRDGGRMTVTFFAFRYPCGTWRTCHHERGIQVSTNRMSAFWCEQVRTAVLAEMKSAA